MNIKAIKEAVKFAGWNMMIFCTLYLSVLFILAYLSPGHQILITMNDFGEANVEILFVVIVIITTTYVYLNTIVNTDTIKGLAKIIKDR